MTGSTPQSKVGCKNPTKARQALSNRQSPWKDPMYAYEGIFLRIDLARRPDLVHRGERRRWCAAGPGAPRWAGVNPADGVQQLERDRMRDRRSADPRHRRLLRHLRA